MPNGCGIMNTMRTHAISITVVLCLLTMAAVGLTLGDCHGDCVDHKCDCGDNCGVSCSHVCSHAVILVSSVPDCVQASTAHSISNEQAVVHTPMCGVFEPPKAIV